MATTIYALKHPETNEVRYIGKTKTALRKRLSCHMSDARAQRRRPVCLWIGKLLIRGLEPLMVPLLVVPDDCFEAYEIACIDLYRRHYPGRLLNLSDGGEGALGCNLPKSPDWCKLMSKKLKGRPLSPAGERARVKRIGWKSTSETREKQRMARLGKKQSSETVAKRSAAMMGHGCSQETRKKIAEKLTGRHHSEEARTNMSRVRTGIKQSEETKQKRSVSMKATLRARRRHDASAINLRAILTRLQVTMEELSRRMGISAQSVASWFKKGNVPVQRRSMVASVLGIEEHDI